MKKYDPDETRRKLFKLLSGYGQTIQRSEQIDTIQKTIYEWVQTHKNRVNIDFKKDLDNIFKTSSLKKKNYAAYVLFPIYIQALAHIVINRKAITKKDKSQHLFLVKRIIKEKLNENNIFPTKDSVKKFIEKLTEKYKELFEDDEFKPSVETFFFLIKTVEECCYEDTILPNTFKIWRNAIW